PELRSENAPQPVDADLVSGVPKTRTKEEAGQVEPARLVVRTPAPSGLVSPEDVPERADRRQGPRVPRSVERLLEPAGERERSVGPLEGCPPQCAGGRDAAGGRDQPPPRPRPPVPRPGRVPE